MDNKEYYRNVLLELKEESSKVEAIWNGKNSGRFDEMFADYGGEYSDMLDVPRSLVKEFIESEIDLAIADYQTNFEQKHIASAVDVAKAEERKRTVEIIKGIEKYQCADLYSQPDDDELILVSNIISIITKDK